MRRKFTILMWLLTLIHIAANIESWLKWKKVTGKVKWLPDKKQPIRSIDDEELDPAGWY